MIACQVCDKWVGVPITIKNFIIDMIKVVNGDNRIFSTFS